MLSFNVNERLSVNVDNDVLKATWLDDNDRNFVKSCWYSVYE